MSLIQTNKKNTQKNKVKIDLEIEKQERLVRIRNKFIA